MFYNATSFRQNLDKWNVTATSSNTNHMFVNSGYQLYVIKLPTWYIKLHPDADILDLDDLYTAWNYSVFNDSEYRKKNNVDNLSREESKEFWKKDVINFMENKLKERNQLTEEKAKKNIKDSK